MDFANLELTDDAVFVQLKHFKTQAPLFDQMPDPENPGEEIDDPNAPIGFWLYGQDSKPMKRVQYALQDRHAERNRMSRGKIVSAAEIDKESKLVFLHCVKEFVRIEWNGKRLVAPTDYELFAEKLPWAFEQVNLAVSDRENFMKRSANS